MIISDLSYMYLIPATSAMNLNGGSAVATSTALAIASGLSTATKIDFKNFRRDQGERIYKVVSFSGNQLFFIRHDIATSIVNKAEFSSLNKMERAIDGLMIKENCIKLEVDRLGNISKA